jgi:predicted flap endonuclease-1-like 5' DNA nuclease
MRSDYVLYVVAIVFFIITAAVATYAVEQQLWIVTTAVLGLAFAGLGYTQKPKPAAAPVTAIVPTPSPPPQPVVTEPVKVEEVKPIVEPQPPAGGFAGVKGIGEKRAVQLKALGINSIEDLAKASAKDLASKLSISPKITEKWVENAKQIGQKP